MNQPLVDNVVEGLNALSDADQREVIRKAKLSSAVKAAYKLAGKRKKTEPKSSQEILWKGIRIDLLPNQYIRSYQEMWRLESILGSDTVRGALRKHHILNAELIEELFKQYPYPFYMTQSETYLFSDYGDISEANGGPLKEITPLDALQRYGLEKLEESIEKQYVRL